MSFLFRVFAFCCDSGDGETITDCDWFPLFFVLLRLKLDCDHFDHNYRLIFGDDHLDSDLFLIYVRGLYRRGRPSLWFDHLLGGGAPVSDGCLR